MRISNSRRDILLAWAVVPPLVLMTLWVFVFPASYWGGWRPGYRAFLAQLALDPHSPTPHDVLTKYERHPAVKLTHLLPSGVWALCGALQFLPGLRAAAPRLHRMSGRLMLLGAAALSVGYVLIESRGLVVQFTDENDGQSAPSGKGVKQTAAIAVLRLVTVWFVLTGVMAFHYARSGRYAVHRRWAVRHLAAGGWVILQRILAAVVGSWAQAVGRVWTLRERHEVFGILALLSMVLTIVGAELFLRLGENAVPGKGVQGERVRVTAAAHAPEAEGVVGQARKKLQ